MFESLGNKDAQAPLTPPPFRTPPPPQHQSVGGRASLLCPMLSISFQVRGQRQLVTVLQG
jgi:hypothetical protein